MMVKGKVIEYWYCKWGRGDAAHLGAQPALPAHQTFWEALALLLCMMAWSSHFEKGNVVLIIGDTVPSLQNTLDLKCRRSLSAVSRDIAWRKARFVWHFDVGHLPSEHNLAPDCLYRQYALEPKPWPFSELVGALERKIPKISDVWQV